MCRVRGCTWLKHWTAELRKHVLPRLFSPALPLLGTAKTNANQHHKKIKQTKRFQSTVCRHRNNKSISQPRNAPDTTAQRDSKQRLCKSLQRCNSSHLPHGQSRSRLRVFPAETPVVPPMRCLTRFRAVGDLVTALREFNEKSTRR